MMPKAHRRSPGSRPCCFSACAGSNDYAGPNSHSRLTQLPYCLPPTHHGVGILICGFSKLNHPAHRCLGLRFATHLAMCHARLEVRMDSLLPFLQGTCTPYNTSVYPGAQCITAHSYTTLGSCTHPPTSHPWTRNSGSGCSAPLSHKLRNHADQQARRRQTCQHSGM